MTGRFPFLAALALGVLCACDATEDPASDGPPPDLVSRTETGPAGNCFALEPIPAIYEQVPGQVQVVQAEIAEDGTVIRPPIYRNATVPRVVRPRGQMRFEVPCPDRLTPEFVSSVQRALEVRGLYAGPVSGRIGDATRAAIRAYQSERGLESDRLSLETARSLGLIEVELPEVADDEDRAIP
ncbi:peptidoglycan-binding domain-containing protein [Roseivivax sediminis]|uniref:Peptidoglycan binding domain-containing protein n=1 Tax=Roseivivax sediminis TaxID=936889 RepID=A0A1I1STU3_9RHOB|nr:peptidoglycan-binding domain-containing protein [Roseivivax sediminis]SFD49836.1 Putative peptidoglycan binding domain-containing protein [Roseivivax sediminis]